MPSWEEETASMYMLIRHKIRDFSLWKQVYDSHIQKRLEAGLSEKHLFTSSGDPHEVIILFEATDLERAKAFSESPDLRERMEQAGVVDKPDIYFLEDHSGMAVMDEIEELKRMEEVFTDRPNKEVSMEFVYHAPDAGRVSLAGNFNNWNTASLPMKKNKRGQWKAVLKLLPGRYEYKYFADGSWVVDKECTEVVSDEKGGVNCVVDVAPKMAA